jgi:hypothetical protein
VPYSRASNSSFVKREIRDVSKIDFQASHEIVELSSKTQVDKFLDGNSGARIDLKDRVNNKIFLSTFFTIN